MKELHALHPSNVTPFFNTANVSLHDQLNLPVELLPVRCYHCNLNITVQYAPFCQNYATALPISSMIKGTCRYIARII